MVQSRAPRNYREDVVLALGTGRTTMVDLYLRTSLVGVGGTILAISAANIWIAYWLVLYLLLEVTFNLHARWRSNQAHVSARAHFWVLVNYASIVLTFCLLPLFLISLDGPQFQFAGFCAVAGLALQALIDHEAPRRLVVINGLCIVVLAIAAGVSWSSNIDIWGGKFMIFSIAAAVGIYFFHTLMALNARAKVAQANRAALAHTQKMDAMGRLSNGISHDFNNLLTVIAGNLDLMKETQPGDERRQLETEARAAVDRGAALVRQLQAASRKSALEVVTVNLRQFLDEFQSMARRLLPANIELTQKEETGEDITLLIDRAQLEAAILNLVINARDAMEDQGGRLSITPYVLELDTTSPEVARGDLRRGRYVCIEVEDTGTGIPADMVGNITDPYVTTKPDGKGSGMGLAMVKGFTEQSGGALTIDSTEGKGTRVFVFLPI